MCSPLPDGLTNRHWKVVLLSSGGEEVELTLSCAKNVIIEKTCLCHFIAFHPNTLFRALFKMELTSSAQYIDKLEYWAFQISWKRKSCKSRYLVKRLLVHNLKLKCSTRKLKSNAQTLLEQNSPKDVPTKNLALGVVM